MSTLTLRRRRRRANSGASQAVVRALPVARPPAEGCLHSWRPDCGPLTYCGEEVIAQCTSCYKPLCTHHVVDLAGELMCLDCWSGYQQAEGSWDYVADNTGE